MIIYEPKKRIFDSGADALCHGCNIKGKMGAGIATQFKERYPDMFVDYVRRCRRNEFQLGTGYMFRNPEKPHIINLATQDTERSGLGYIDSAFEWLAGSYQDLGIESVAMPKIGVGLGGLQWQQVDELIRKHFQASDLMVEVYLR